MTSRTFLADEVRVGTAPAVAPRARMKEMKAQA